MSALRTIEQVAADLQVSEWTVAELVRRGKASCVRLGTTADRKLVRFTDEQVAELVAAMTVNAKAEFAPRRRKRRAS